MAESEALETNCDPICRLEECLSEEFASFDWNKDPSCGGKAGVEFTVTSAKPDDRKAQLRGYRFINLFFTAVISVDNCRAGSCTAGLIQQQLCHLIEGKKICGGCVTVDWINTERSISTHSNKEVREVTFVATLKQQKK